MKNSSLWPSDKPGMSKENQTLISVMHCDIVNSTPLSTRATPNELRRLLLRYYAICDALARQSGGRATRFIGDAVQTVFTTQRYLSTPPDMAIAAAVSVRNTVTKTLKDLDGNSLQVRIGVATGYGLLDRYTRFDGMGQEMIWGPMPFLAARLQEQANIGDVVMCDKTAKLVRADWLLSNMGLIDPKGFDTSVRAWSLRSGQCDAASGGTFSLGGSQEVPNRRRQVTRLRPVHG